MRVLARYVTLIAWIIFVSTLSAAQGPGPGRKTSDNLQTFLDLESSAQTRYLAFAAKADAEGYGPIGSLFRALARSEEIHARNSGALIRERQTAERPQIPPLVVSSTAENLELSLQAEKYQRDVLYAGFLESARAEGNANVVKFFRSVLIPENEHHRLLAETYRSLQKLAGSNPATFYVCPGCGLASSTLDFDNCPCCGETTEKFERKA